MQRGWSVRLDAIVRDRNGPQKHVWRARIILLSADGIGTVAMMRAVGKDKRAVWRWQERFMRIADAAALPQGLEEHLVAIVPGWSMAPVVDAYQAMRAPPSWLR